MRIAVVGAGVSGLAAARAFVTAGLDVVVYEERTDVGGVWSASRRYPGVRTQNDKRSYAFSDLPMPSHYPEYPSGADIQAYLAEFSRRNRLDDVIRLGTKVETATPQPDGSGWLLQVRDADGLRTERFDWLIMANGICSMPHIPHYEGADAFTAAGGAVLAPSGIGDGERLRDRDVVVVGWGKSAADIAVAAVQGARSVTVVARGIGWKLPWKIGRMKYQRLVLTRLGEHLLWAPQRTFAGKVLRRVDAPIRGRIVRAIERRIRAQLELDRRGLVPSAGLDEFTHMVTPGFFEAIDAGRIRLVRGAKIRRLEADEAGRRAVLDNGDVVAADVVVAATGYDQDLGFLSDTAKAALLDEHGEMHLYLHTVPERLPRIAFLGWMNSFRSPIGAEMQAVWVTALLLGRLEIPTGPARRAQMKTYRLTHAAAAARGLPQFSSGASILDLDQWLSEAGLQVPRRTRLMELIRPLDPASYRGMLPQLLARESSGSLHRDGR
jgi:cation diffusion facilitator CzcD-associated flavoprotein CzcO